MKKIVAFILLIPTIALCDSCDVQSVLQMLRPGAEWSISNNDVVTLVWLSTQTVPTKPEVLAAVATCRSDLAARKTLKAQSRVDVKNSGLTIGQRLQALLILLDYDR